MQLVNIIRRTVGLTALACALATGMAGCSSATDVSQQPTPQELEAAKQRQANAVEQRTDLTPEQREGLRHHYGGGGPNAGPGRPGGPGR